jgi:hypothetical protein
MWLLLREPSIGEVMELEGAGLLEVLFIWASVDISAETFIRSENT